MGWVIEGLKAWREREAAKRNKLDA